MSVYVVKSGNQSNINLNSVLCIHWLKKKSAKRNSNLYIGMQPMDIQTFILIPNALPLMIFLKSETNTWGGNSIMGKTTI